MLGDEWLRWLTERVAPFDQAGIIVWGRTDLFYGGAPATGNP
jgi:hypothetical protein